MSKRSVNILVKITFEDNNPEHNEITTDEIDFALQEMDYSFSYKDDELEIVGTEIIETFVPPYC